MTTFASSPRGSASPSGERSQRFTDAAIAGCRVQSAKHHSFSVPETIGPKASSQNIPGSYPEGHQSPAPVQVDSSQDTPHAGHDHRPVLKVDLPTHEEPTGARAGVGSLPGPNSAEGVAILPDEKENPLNGEDKREAPNQEGVTNQKVPEANLPSTEEPTGSRTGIGSMPGSNSEAGVATLPEERIDGRPYGQGHTGFEESLEGVRQTQHQKPTNRCPVDPAVMGLDSNFKEVETPAEPSGERDSHLANQVQRAGGGTLGSGQIQTQEPKDAISMGGLERNRLGAVELAEVSVFLEGGSGSTTAGGKYEIVFEPALPLPAPDEAATSKEPSEPSAPFSMPKAVSSVEHQTVKEIPETPVFIEGGHESTTAGGKYEAVFKPRLPDSIGSTESQAIPPAPGPAPYLGKPVSKEEEMAQIEQARGQASKKATGIN